MDVGKSCTGNISRTGVQKCILFQEQSSGYRKKEQDRQNDHLAFRDTEHDAEITLVKRYGRRPLSGGSVSAAKQLFPRILLYISVVIQNLRLFHIFISFMAVENRRASHTDHVCIIDERNREKSHDNGNRHAADGIQQGQTEYIKRHVVVENGIRDIEVCAVHRVQNLLPQCGSDHPCQHQRKYGADNVGHPADGFVRGAARYGFQLSEIFFFQKSQIHFRKGEYDDKGRDADFQLCEELFKEDLRVSQVFKPPVIRDKGNDRTEAQNQNDKKENYGRKTDFLPAAAFVFLLFCFSFTFSF